MIDVAGTTLTGDDREVLRHPAVGGVILFTRNFASREQLCALTADIHGLRRPSLLIAVDQEGGRVQRFGEPFTRIPPAAHIGQCSSEDMTAGTRLARACGWLMAAELRACGVDLSFAPVVDLDHGVCAVIGDRAFHRDAAAVGRLAGAYMGGMHEAGMAATAKHFPGHGAVSDDSHLTLPVDPRPYPELESGLAPYRVLIGAGLDAVMMALVAYPAIDTQPASFSSQWIRGELRQRLGFTGAVFSDDLSMGGAAGGGSMTDRVRTALRAGCDMVPVCNDRAAVARVLDRVERHNPASHARLASLHGRRAPDWERLRNSPAWRRARGIVDSGDERPLLELD